jgi:hypothetical protein
MAKHKMLSLGDFLREKSPFFGYVSCRSLKSSAHPPWGASIQWYERAPAREADGHSLGLETMNING